MDDTQYYKWLERPWQESFIDDSFYETLKGPFSGLRDFNEGMDVSERIENRRWVEPMGFETIPDSYRTIKKDERAERSIRRKYVQREKMTPLKILLLPVIKKGLITGFCIKRCELSVNGNIVISYRHEKLKCLSHLFCRRCHKHKRELVKMIYKNGIISPFELEGQQIIEGSTSVYEIPFEWRKLGRVIDIFGDKLEKEDMVDDRLFKPEFEGAGSAYLNERQFDLFFGLNDVGRARDLLGALLIGGSKYRISEGGKLEENPEAVHGAWEVPLITITSDEFRPPGFVGVEEFSVYSKRAENSVATTLVGKRAGEFEEYLKTKGDKGVFYSKRPVLVNRLFVENYLDK